MLCAAPAQQHMLCIDCERDLPWRSGHRCPVCAVSTGTTSICGPCLKNPRAFDATHALLDYRFPVNAVLQRYKYSGLLAVSELMGQLLARDLQAASRPELLIPMPLHPTRLQERGFNQATEIARVVAKALDIPLSTRLCSRTRPTQPQTGLPLKERKRNMRGVFACSQNLAGKHVALLDDVMTTGASLDALARAVKDAGAARVDCWVIARTLPT